DGIVSGLTAALRSPIFPGMKLVAIRRNAVGEFELTFTDLPDLVRADAVVLAVPFTTLRQIALDPSLGLPPEKLNAIQTLGYGNNSKTMIGFNGRIWNTVYGSSGAAYSDLTEVQNTWQTNPSRAGATAILTDYASGLRGQTLNDRDLQVQVGAFLTDL